MISKTKLMAFFRDPVWQAVGVLVAIAAIWIASAASPPQKSTLSIYHLQKIKFEEYRLPTDQIRLVLLGTKEEISRAVVDYFVVVNDSTKPILTTDFSSPIFVSKGAKTKRVFLVASCASIATDQRNQVSNTKVALNWRRSADKWSAEPILLNPGDYSCVTVISEEAVEGEKAAPPHDRFQWDGRIVNIQVKSYDSPDDYAKTRPSRWSDYIGAVIFMSGFTPYWFVCLQILFFFATAVLAHEAGWVSTYRSIDLAKLALIVLLSTGSAESLTSVFTYSSLSDLHPVVFLIVALHLLLIVTLTILAKRPMRTPAQVLIALRNDTNNSL